MSASAWNRSRPPASPSESSASAGRASASRRSASSPDSLASSSARAVAGVRHSVRSLRGGLLAALPCLPLLAGLSAEVQAQDATASIRTGGNHPVPSIAYSDERGDTASNRTLILSRTQSSAVPFRVCFSSPFDTPGFSVARGSTPVTLTNGCHDDTVAFANNTESAIFWVYGTPDAIDEPNEVVVLTFTDDPDNPRPPGVAQINVVSTITIIDDDPTVVSLAKAGAATAIDEGQKVEFTVTLGRALVEGEIIDVPLSIGGAGVTTGDWSLAKKSGKANTGVTLQDTGTTTPKVRFFGVGAETATLELTATDDGAADSGESFSIALGADSAFDASGLGTNVGGGADPHGTNNDFSVTVNDVPTLSIDLASPSLAEGHSGGTDVTVNYRMSRGRSAGFPFLACVDTAASTATHRAASGGKAADWNLVHFVAKTNVSLNAQNCHTYNYPANATLRNFSLRVFGDRTAEGNETAVVTVRRAPGTPAGIALGTSSATLTISNDDGAVPTVTISGGAAVTEGTGAQFTVNASTAPAANLTVDLIVSDAGGGSDFVAAGDEGAKTVTILAGQTSATHTVPTAGDQVDEPNGQVTVAIVARAEGYAVGGASSATTAVNDDDATAGPELSVSLGSNSGSEGDSGSRFVDVDIALSPARSTNTRFLMCVKNTGTATFRSDTGGKTRDFDLTDRNSNTGLTLDGSNCHVHDIAGGSASSGVSLRIFGDTDVEPDETAVVELRRHADTPSAVSISSAQGSATYTIRNDDNDPPAELSLIWTETIPPRPLPREPKFSTGREVGKEVSETDSGTTDVPFYVRTERLHSSKLPFRVCVSGNATQSTTNSPQPDVEDDYQVVVDGAVQGRCFNSSIPANQRFKKMKIRILNDDRFEYTDAEMLRLELTQAPGNPLPSPWKIVSRESGYWMLILRIQDDDWPQQPVQFSSYEYEKDFRIKNRRVKEGQGGYTGILFSWGGSYTVTYRVVHAESTATYGADYTLGNYNRNTNRGTLRVPRKGAQPGSSYADLQVNVVDDSLAEGEEKFVIEMVSISSPKTVDKTNDRHRLSIAIDDNDNTAYLRVNPEQATLSADGAERRITMSAGVPLPVDVHFEYCVEEGTATLGTDYELTGPDGAKVTGTGCHLATLPAGSAGIDLTVRMLDGDDRVEPDEQVKIRLRKSTVPGKETASSTVEIKILPSTVELDKDGNAVNMAAIVTLKDDDVPTLEVAGQRGAGQDGKLIAFTVRAVNGPFYMNLNLHWELDDPGDLIDGDMKTVTRTRPCTQFLRDVGFCTGSTHTYTTESPVHRKKSGVALLARGKTKVHLDFLVRDSGPDGSVTLKASEGKSFRLVSGKGLACVAIRGGACSGGQGGSSDDTAVPPQPTASVANVQVAAVDATSATVTWDAVEHATSYRVEYAGTASDPANNVQGSVEGHADTTWTFEHNAAEAMTLTVTVTPEYVDGNGDTQRLADLAGTATLDVAAPQPTTAVANVQVTAVDATSATVTWDAVEHATSYRVAYEGTASDPANNVQGSVEGHADTTWTFRHDAAEAMTVTVTVTPEHVDGNGDTQRLADLAGTATIDVAPAETQDTVGTAVCETASLKSDIAGYIGEQADGTPHVTRWKRVLATLGDANGYTVMTAAEAEQNADDFWAARWNPVVTAIQCLENAASADPEVAVTGGSSVTEGGDAVFTVTADPAPSSDLDVTLDVADAAAGDFLAASDEGSHTVTVPANQPSATLTLSTTGDSADEPDGNVSASVASGTGYTVAADPGDAATVAVTDDDATTVTLTVPDATATEGDASDTAEIVLTLGRGLAAGESLAVPLLFEGGAAGTLFALACPDPLPAGVTCQDLDGDPQVTFTGPESSVSAMTVTLSFTAREDTGAVNETVTVSIPASSTGNAPVLAATGLGGGATGARTGNGQIAIADDDATASEDCYEDVKPDVAGYVLETGNGTAHVTRWERVLAAFGEDNGKTPMTVAEAQQNADDFWAVRWDPVVTALRCLENAGTGTDSTTSTEPEIAVSGGGSVTEGGDAVFTVTADPAPSSDLDVTLDIEDDATSDFLATSDEGSHTVTVPANQPSATLTLATVNDGAEEPDGSVSATLAGGAGYTVGSPSAATVAVSDDDDPVPDPVTPELRLSAGSPVDEGGNAVFTVHADAAPAADLTVALTVSQTGDVLSASTGSRQLTLAAGATSATLTLATDDDGVDEPDGAAIVTLDAGTGYTVAAGQAAGAVAVRDNDDPVISIAAGNGVTEGNPASFTLTANPVPHAALTVSLAVTQGGDYAASGQTGTRNVTIPTGGSIAFEVATVNDPADEPDGSVTATLAAGSGYAVAASPDDAASVAVADDDVAVAGVPTLSVNDVEVKEGPYRRVAFTVTLSEPASSKGAWFWWRVRESTPVSAKRGVDFSASAGKKFASMRPGATEHRIMAALVIDDSHDEDPETFEIVLSDANGAAIADGVGVATIVNDDPMPAAFLSRFGRTVAEQALDGIAGRIAAPRDPGVSGSFAGHVDLGSLAARGDVGTGEDSVRDAATALAADGNGVGNAEPDVGHGIGHVPPDGHGPALAFLADGGGGGSGSGSAARGSRSREAFLASGHDGSGDGTEVRSVTLEDAILATGFTATRGTDAAGGSLAFWGRADLSGFDGREGTFSLDGEAATAMLGADYARGRWLAGLMVMQSSGDGGYADAGTGDMRCPQDLDAVLCGGAVREGDGDVAVEASLTSAVPYLAYGASERIRLWGALGRGTGEVTLEPETGGDPLAAGLSWSMAAAGLRGDLLRAPSGAFPALAVTADALATRTSSDATDGLAASESDTSRLRVGIEGSWDVALDGGGRLRPRLEIGARHDGGDAETGLGIELGGGVSWTDPGLGVSLDLSGRTLVVHDDNDLADRGVSLSVTFDPDPDTNRGPTISMKQDLGGAASGGIDALFAHDPLEDRAGDDTGVRRTLEAAWGLPAFGGRFTGSPHAGLSTAGDARDWTLGWRLAPEGERPGTPDLTFGTRAVRREGGDGAATHSVGVEAGIRW